MTTTGSETTTAGAAAAAQVDWERMEEWDRAYYLHNVQGPRNTSGTASPTRRETTSTWWTAHGCSTARAS